MLQNNGLLLLDPGKQMPARYIFGSSDVHGGLLTALNQVGYGVFGCVNQATPTGRTQADVTHLLAFYADFDNGVPDWRECPLRPSRLVQSSPGKQQAYWYLREPVENTPTAAAEYLGIEHALVKKLGADLNARDIARVLRLPGFANTKYATRPEVTELYAADHTYTMDEVKNAMGYIAQPVTLGFERTALADEEHAKTRLQRAIERNPPPTEPHTWAAWLYKTAAWAIGNLGLSANATEDALIAHLSGEGFSVDEICRTVKNADKYCRRGKPPALEIEL